MDFPCAANSCIVFTVLLLIMAASWVYDQPHTPQLTAISGGGQFYPGAIIRLFQLFGEASVMMVKEYPRMSVLVIKESISQESLCPHPHCFPCHKVSA